jgi:hypothetical protein
MIIDRLLGTKQSVYFQQLTQKDIKKLGIYKVSPRRKDGWAFDWYEPLKQGLQVFALITDSEPSVVQGLLALKPNSDLGCLFMEITNVESAPQNKALNPQRKYIGVGEHLIALACKLSIEQGFDGYVQFKSKTTSIAFYEKIGAKHIHNGVMYFDTLGAVNIIKRCGL